MASARMSLPLTPAVFHVLLVLADGRSHGYALMQEIERLTDGRIQLGPGTMYRSLQKMVLDGLIEELPLGVGEDDDDERRRYYRLTPHGLSVARAEAERLAALVTLARYRGLLPAGSP
jgi:DNA-binding PadR family transcriptional regulator